MGLFDKHIYPPKKGVSKNAKNKNKFFRFVDLIIKNFWNLCLLNAMYVLSCLPIVTIGAASAGFTYVLKNMVMGKPVFIFSDYWKGIKNNWKLGSLLFAFNVIFFFVIFIAYSFYNSPEIIESSLLRTVFSGFLILLSIFYVIMQFYTYLLLVTFDIKLKQLLKNSLLFIVLGIKNNLVAAFFTAVYVFLLLIPLFPLSILFCLFFLLSIMGLTVNFIVFPTVKTYMIDPVEAEQPQQKEEEPIFRDTTDD